MGTITVYSPTANVNSEVYLSYGPCYLAEQCITKENYASKNAGKLIQEINIRLAGFGGNVPSEEFTDRTENMIRQFQRDYMNVPETGKICGGLLRAIDEFCSKAEYCFDFSQTACPCPNDGYEATTGYSLCSGYGNNKSDSGGIEHPRMHRSLLFILKALLFYFEKNAWDYYLTKK